MSNSLAIAAVTATLQSLLQSNITSDSELSDTKVTILPLDKARHGISSNQLNIFLYQVVRNATWTNQDMPRQSKPGERNYPPLPLNLYYLITAFGRDDDVAQPFSHRVLGKAMSLLHDYPVFNPEDIKAATSGLMPEADLDKQIEHVRLTLHPTPLDELSKLWTGFASQFRLSAAYEVDVTLIDSLRSPAAPLPILTRGQGDSGVASQPDLTPTVPTLASVTPPNAQPSVRLGEVLTLTGSHLDGSNVGVQFSHPLLTAPIEVAPDPGGTDKLATVTIPNLPAAWPAGFYGVSLLVQQQGENFRRTTNTVPVTLAPAIAISPMTPMAGNIVFTLTCAPQIRPEQRVTLMLKDKEIAPNSHLVPTATLTFPAVALTAGLYPARLRVDGVDSLLVKRDVKPPVYDPTQIVKVS
jgi:Pvc16 N-terminal domain